MKYTEWIKAELPHLENESSAITFEYIQQAKDSTVKLRMVISIVSIILYILAGYMVGYLLGKYTEINSDVALAISIGLVIWILSRLEDQFKDSIIKKELLLIAGKNT
ncbi:hypothetical protein [Cognaticolwellia beringensis]|uniref:Uncharacterized protein n=1 Tax=Cognaticolwellia beringensis TaxID=1967665 RepID=A0A222GD17_9GAMM|nr:hypothetical protein [Cognaticolwellia beringensis]ASP49756.1 hypothetical protein B5D82_19460 [Cognaticolwellia beringensis]